MRAVWGGLLAAVMAFGFEVPAVSAAADTAQVSRQKINLAGRQRMLSQRMSAAACLAMAGVPGANYDEWAGTAYSDFKAALAGLRDGDAALGLPVETNMNVRAAFDAVAETWSVMSPAVQQTASGYRGTTPVVTIMETNTELLTRSNAAVQEIVKAYGGAQMDPGVGKAIDVAGRQRMLSQRMLKSVCFTYVGVGGDAPISELVDSIALFDKSLTHLSNGSTAEGIAVPPSKAIKDQFEVVQALWSSMKPDLDAIANGETLTTEMVGRIAGQADALLKQSHQAVLRYVEMADSGPKG